MQIPIMFSIVIIFVVWLQYEIRKTSRLEKKSLDNFWQKESQANATRKTDLSHLDFITIPDELLSMPDEVDTTLNSYRDTIRELAVKKICNLTGYTNSDLKLKYGTANFSLLAEYDNNYTVLVSMLQKWGERLYSNGKLTEAMSVLEYATEWKTDAANTYRLLSHIYVDLKTPEKMDHLLCLLENSNIRNKAMLIKELTELRNS